MRAGGMPEGKYTLGNLDVITDSKSARLKNGTLAGSIVKLNKAVDLFRKYSNISLNEAVAMASYDPACNLGIERQCGSIKPGLRADLVLVDKNMDVLLTVLNGEILFIK